jgi:hypothetical protein
MVSTGDSKFAVTLEDGGVAVGETKSLLSNTSLLNNQTIEVGEEEMVI